MTDGGRISAPGFYGKLPARGDFLARRMSQQWRDGWHGWLAQMTAAVRAAVAPPWEDAWLTAPLWHFMLGAELAPPAGAAGILLCSADRVGRLFPFTIVATAPCGGFDAEALRRWCITAEQIALDALGDAGDPDVLDAALRDLGPPPPVSGPPRQEGTWLVELDGDWPRRNAAPNEAPLLCAVGAAQSAWWCRGSERMSPTHLRCRGLPDAALSRAMVAGGLLPPATDDQSLPFAGTI